MSDWFIGDVWNGLANFFHQGGVVLYAILAITILMWTFIVERYWYFWFNHKHHAEAAVNEWRQRTDTESWFALRVRDKLVSEVSQSAGQYLLMIRTCIAVLPLLGLLGTVTGMITVFDVIASVGTGNARAMALGVSHATIPTMAGMTAAISGIFFSAQLDRWASNEVEEIEDQLQRF
ncbi:MAG TPA: MotA/TolQ/ExbB proton channel family protein [Gammaproteobacteria bacterium]|jgi:biopolymer transport protein ExbB|nr:MotA/TolQ/ExbB proton channel family protein [Gammaproteobacteria bacterium]